MNNETNLPISSPAGEKAIALKPLGWWPSLPYFGIPALILAAASYWFRPWLQSLGASELVSYFVALCVPMALMFFTALVFYKYVEGQPLTRAAFSARMRYPRLRVSDVLWGVGIAVAGVVLSGLFSQVSSWLISVGFIPLPAGLPLLDNPTNAISPELLNQAAGGLLRGQWWLLVLHLVTYFFNVVGEELWWRGIILPRQELAFGRFTWLVHGLLWACHHVFKYWNILSLVPVCLLIAFFSQRRQNNWAALIAHALVNGLVVLLILALVAGWL